MGLQRVGHNWTTEHACLGSQSSVGNRLLPGTRQVNTLILDFQPPELWGINLRLSHLVYGILLWQPWAKTVIISFLIKFDYFPQISEKFWSNGVTSCEGHGPGGVRFWMLSCLWMEAEVLKMVLTTLHPQFQIKNKCSRVDLEEKSVSSDCIWGNQTEKMWSGRCTSGSCRIKRSNSGQGCTAMATMMRGKCFFLPFLPKTCMWAWCT